MGEDACDSRRKRRHGRIQKSPSRSLLRSTRVNCNIKTTCSSSFGTRFLLYGTSKGSFISNNVLHEIGEFLWEIHGLWDGIKGIGGG